MVTNNSINSPVLNNIVNGRITLSTGVPVTTSDVTAATTIYFTPYQGNNISLYDGSAIWNVISFTELSIAVPATTATMYDVFCYNNSGAATLEVLAWTNDTTRATALVLQNGVYVKSGATTRRYLGSFRTTGVSGQTEDSVANRFVWNYYNRVSRQMYALPSTSSWTYTTATLRQANGSTSNQLNFIVGVSENVLTALASSCMTNTFGGTVNVKVAIGLNSTSTAVATAIYTAFGQNGGSNNVQTGIARYNGYPPIGRNYLAWLEYSDANGTTTWYGTNSAAGSGSFQAGINGEILA